MIISPTRLLRDAQEKHYAVPAFNFYNLDILFAVLEAAEEESSPVIVQIYHVYYPFLHQRVIASAVQEALRATPAGAYLHLDHATEYTQIMAAMEDGFQSVMIDASAKPLEENIALTKAVVSAAKQRGVFTEAEIGRIPPAAQITAAEPLCLAEAEECRHLVQASGVDSLAAAVGTAHGVYRTPPKLDFPRISDIAQAVQVPLVLHGGSGTPEQALQRAIQCGIAKINVGTELKHAWSAEMSASLASGELEPRILSARAREAVKQIAKQKIRLFGASGKNPSLSSAFF